MRFPAFLANLYGGWRRVIFAVLLSLALIGVGHVFLPPAAGLGVEVKDLPFYSMPFGDKPFAPAEWRTADGKMVNWRAVPAAERCGNCHRKEYMEWNTSLHAVSDLDLIYDAAVTQNVTGAHAGAVNGDQKGRWCESCHNPLGVLTGAVNPITSVQETEALEQGVSCIVCHTASHPEPMVGNGALVSNINGIFRHLDEALITAAPSRHARDMQAKRSHPFMGQSDLCGACHTEIRPTQVSGQHRLDFQSTFEEWRASPFRTKGVQCQDCHMAQDPAAFIAALKRGENPAKQVSHRFIGGNYLLTNPDLPDAQLKELRGGRPSGSFVLFKPEEYKAQMGKTNQQVVELLKAAADLKVDANASADGALAVKVSVGNTGAGHALPTGPLDQRHMWLEVKVLDASGKMVFHSGAYDEKAGYLTDPKAALWVKRMEHFGKPGKPDLRHILFDVERLSYPRKPIPAGESQTVAYDVKVPPAARGPYRIEAKLWYRIAFQEILENITEQGMGDMTGVVIPRLLIGEAQTTTASGKVAATMKRIGRES